MQLLKNKRDNIKEIVLITVKLICSILFINTLFRDLKKDNYEKKRL